MNWKKNIAPINKGSVRSYVRHAQSPDITHTTHCLLDLLYAKNKYTCLSLFSRNELVLCYFPFVYRIVVYSFLCTFRNICNNK